jgi:hypothetical protein
MRSKYDEPKPPRIEPRLGLEADAFANRLRLEGLPDHLDGQKRAALTDRRRARRRAAIVIGVVAFVGAIFALVFYDVPPTLGEQASRAVHALIEDAVRVRAALNTRSRQAVMPTDAERKAREAARKEAAWKDFFKRSTRCTIESNQTSVECVNEYIRAKRDFDQRWDAGQL